MPRNDILAVIGLILGSTFGIGGTLVSTDSLRQIFWMIDGVGLVVATSLLAVRFFRAGDDIAAAGFLVFALGESLLIAGNAAGLDASVPSFGGGVALWSAGLFLISLSNSLAMWIRAVHVIAALLFAIVAFRITSGEHLVPTSSTTVLRVSVCRSGVRRLDRDDSPKEVRLKADTTRHDRNYFSTDSASRANRAFNPASARSA